MFGIAQRRQYRPDCGKAPLKQLLSEGMTLLGEIKCYGPPVLPLTALDQTIGNEAIDEAYRTRVREAKNAAQFLVRRAQPISDNDERRRGFTGMVENVAPCLLDAANDFERKSAEQIGGSVDHATTICAERIFFNLTICALRT